MDSRSLQCGEYWSTVALTMSCLQDYFLSLPTHTYTYTHTHTPSPVYRCRRQLFTALSSFSYGLLEQDVSARGRMTHPHLYKTSQQGNYFNTKVRSMYNVVWNTMLRLLFNALPWCRYFGSGSVSLSTTLCCYILASTTHYMGVSAL